MNEDIGKEFANTYENCGENYLQYVSNEFTRWIDFSPFLATQSYMDIESGKWHRADVDRKLMSSCAFTGYLIRCTEELTTQFSKYDISKLNKIILEILQSKESKYDKLVKITEYLNVNDKIKLGETVRPFTILEYEYLKYLFDIIFLDYCKQLNINLEDPVTNELSWRMASYGYAFKTAEKIFDSLGDSMRFNKENINLSSLASLIAKVLIDETEKYVPDFLEYLFGKDNFEEKQKYYSLLKVELLIFVLHYFERKVFSKFEEIIKIETKDDLNYVFQKKLTSMEYVEYKRLYETRNTFFLGFDNLFPEDNQSKPGTLLWEYGKLICATYPHKSPTAILGFHLGLPILIGDVFAAFNKKTKPSI